MSASLIAALLGSLTCGCAPGTSRRRAAELRGETGTLVTFRVRLTACLPDVTMLGMRILAVLVLVLVCASCGGGVGVKAAEEPATPALEVAGDKCSDELADSLVAAEMSDEAVASDFLQVGDEGHSLTITNAPQGGDLSALLTIPTLACVLDEVEAPDSLNAKIEQTSALMGRQEEAWDDYTLEWSYHPDSGVSAVLTQG